MRYKKHQPNIEKKIRKNPTNIKLVCRINSVLRSKLVFFVSFQRTPSGYEIDQSQTTRMEEKAESRSIVSELPRDIWFIVLDCISIKERGRGICLASKDFLRLCREHLLRKAKVRIREIESWSFAKLAWSFDCKEKTIVFTPLFSRCLEMMQRLDETLFFDFEAKKTTFYSSGLKGSLGFADIGLFFWNDAKSNNRSTCSRIQICDWSVCKLVETKEPMFDIKLYSETAIEEIQQYKSWIGSMDMVCSIQDERQKAVSLDLSQQEFLLKSLRRMNRGNRGFIGSSKERLLTIDWSADVNWRNEYNESSFVSGKSTFNIKTETEFRLFVNFERFDRILEWTSRCKFDTIDLFTQASQLIVVHGSTEIVCQNDTMEQEISDSVPPPSVGDVLFEASSSSDEE